MGIVTLLSDFGSSSPYPAAMKAVLARRSNPTLIDISHDVPRHDIRAAAFLLYSAAPNFPAGTVHLAVVDPGVGSSRRPLIVASGGQFFVGPDNGLLIPAARRLGALAAFEITDPSILRDASSTFHGRDVFAPAAELLAWGTPPKAVASPITEFADLDFGAGVRINGALRGQVIYVDPFGNLITNIASELLHEAGGRAELRIGTRRGVGRFARTYSEIPPRSVAVLGGSDGLIEIALREGSAAERFHAKIGTPVRIGSMP